MTIEPPPTKRKRKRKPHKSGTEERQRTAWLPMVRCLPEERAAIQDAADRAGISIAAYIMAATLKVTPPRPASRVPLIDRQLLTQLLAQLGKIGSNVNQIAKSLNMDEGASLPEIRQAGAAIVELRNPIMTALGKGKRD